MRFSLPNTALAALLALSVAAPAGLAAAQNDAAESAGADANGTAAGEALSQEAQACLDRIRTLAEDVGGQNRPISSQQMRTLHESARILADNGQVEACDAVVTGMREIAEGTEPVSDSREAEMQQILQDATPMEEMQGTIQIGSLIGASVLNPEGRRLGDVDEVVMTTDNQTRYLLIGTGGIFGLGERFVPVELERFRFADEDRLVLDVSQEHFDQAPTYETTAIGDTVTEWKNEVAQWWDGTTLGE